MTSNISDRASGKAIRSGGWPRVDSAKGETYPWNVLVTSLGYPAMMIEISPVDSAVSVRGFEIPIIICARF
jgi:hypothetical protein